MSLASYVRGSIEMETPLDTSACSNVVLTIKQEQTEIDLTTYTTTEDFGVFCFELSAENAAKLVPGVCCVQLRGFVTSNGKTEEFYTLPHRVQVDNILYQHVI